MSTEDSDLHQRMLNLENELKLLKMGSALTSPSASPPASPKSKKNRKPRVPTEYNKFMSKFINEQKEELGADFNHKVAFGQAAKTWTKNKNS